MSTETLDLAGFFETGNLDARTVEQYADAAHTSFQARERFEFLLGEYRQRADSGQGDPLRVALALVILGRYAAALDYFAKVKGGALRHYYAAEAALGLGRFDQALQELKSAAAAGWDGLAIDMRMAAIHIRAGNQAAAEELVKKHEAGGATRAAWHVVRGLLCEARDERAAAADAYEAALQHDARHTEALFRLARLYDQFGSEQEALDLYDRLTEQPRAYINALLNAAVVYEDHGNYEGARQCLLRVLKAYPNHRRARLFLKSVESCREALLDEGVDQQVDASKRLFSTPLSEFELSVRARNCLKKMSIRTLGELVKLSEAELLAYKNFGETSLAEIKALLAKKGLALGMAAEGAALPAEAVPAAPRVSLPPGQEAILSRPVSELELSVRSRRCLQRLNVHTLGELIQLSEADLLATRNFGVTSLNEIRARLADLGFSLAAKRES